MHSTDTRAACYTFGILRTQRGDKQAQGFFDRIEGAFQVAATAHGHLAAYRGVVDTTPCGPRFLIAGIHDHAPRTLSLWTDLASGIGCADPYRNIDRPPTHRTERDQRLHVG